MKSNEELIEEVKENNREKRRVILAKMIAKLDEEIAYSTSQHDLRIARQMTKRETLLNAMNEDLSDEQLERLTGGF